MITPFELSLRSGQILDCSFIRRLDLYHASRINAAGKYRPVMLTRLPASLSGLLTE
jgi:hypothetical protein